MLVEHIRDEELSFIENFFNPICLSESLFSNFDNLIEFGDSLGEVRLYQYPMLSYEAIIDTDNSNLTKAENFELRKGAGDVYNMGARKTGKSQITQKLDIPLSLMYDDNMQVAFSSSDQVHLDDILKVVARTMESHPIVSMFRAKIQRSPKYYFVGKNGWVLNGVNANIAAKDSGTNWFGLHVHKIYLEEISLENESAYEKRKDATSEFGAIFRCSGMTNFTRHQPAGKMFYAPENQAKIVSMPQYVNPTFTSVRQKQMEEQYGGKSTIGYRVFVDAEVVEDGVSVIDVERIRQYINEKQDIKSFEIKKESFAFFRSLLVVNRPKNIDRIFIGGDVGDGRGGTAITIFSEIDDIFHYLYRIELYSLADDEQFEIFEWLISKLQANIVGIDCGDGTGRAIYRRLSLKYSSDNLVRYAGVEKIGVDYLKNDKGEVLLENGKPILIEERMAEWSVRYLISLLYSGQIKMPRDYKLERQLSYVVSRVQGNNTCYSCISPDGDHIFDSFKIFATSVWLKKNFNATPKMSKEVCLGVSNWNLKEENKIDASFIEAIKDRKEIECSKEEYKNKIHQYLTTESMKTLMNNDAEYSKYIDKEMNRLNMLFNGA